MKVNRVDSSNIARGCLKVFGCNATLHLCHRRRNNYDFMENAVNAVIDSLKKKIICLIEAFHS